MNAAGRYLIDCSYFFICHKERLKTQGQMQVAGARLLIALHFSGKKNS